MVMAAPADPCGPEVVASVVREHRDASSRACDEVATVLDGEWLQRATYDAERGSLLLVINTFSTRVSVSDATAATNIEAMVLRAPTRLRTEGRSGSIVLTARNAVECHTLRCFASAQNIC